MKSGFVGVVGRPNAGKSTLINSIIGKKVAITSDKPQTTRNVIHGIYNEEGIQIIFVDTPGIHKPNHKLGDYLNRQAYSSSYDVDVILFMVDANEQFGKGDMFVLEKIKNTGKPIILVLNKIDKFSKDELLIKIDKYKDIYDFNDIVPTSALKNKNIKELINTIKEYLNDDIKYYDDNDITNKPISFLVAEIVREKVFNMTKEEVPHSLTCIVEGIKNKKDISYINVAIIVDRESLKKIIIGKNGNMIKNIGIKSRPEIEQLLNRKVYLELYVKVIENWRDREKYLKDFGFNEFDE